MSPSTSDAPVAAASPGARTFRWDFSKERTWTYTYAQRMKMRVDEHEEDMTADGFLDIVSKGDGAANLVLRDVAARTGAATAGDDASAQVLPTSVVPGMKEDGSTSEGGASAVAFLKALFPLPRRPLAAGESDDVPISLPYNTNGTELPLRGSAKVTFTGFAEPGERGCAMLSVVVDASRLDVPPELPGTHAGSLKGTAKLCFDPVERAFVNGTYAFVMSMKTEMPGVGGQAIVMDTNLTLDRKKP